VQPEKTNEAFFEAYQKWKEELKNALKNQN
jgi:hypothetical protein